jgi:transposase
MDQPSTPPPTRGISQAHRAQRARDLTRSQRIRCRALRFDAGWKQSSIARQLHFTARQVETACHKATPTKRSGRPLSLSTLQVNELITWISLSRQNRRMTYLEIATTIYPFCNWNISAGIVTHALALRGYGRHIAIGKPGLSEASKHKRLKFAEDHITWTIEQWFSILWSDETWVNGYHRKIWVTRKAGEEHEDSCLFSKQQRRRGWMFWGCFSGRKKGPCLFWEKSWKSINSERYCKHILPLIERYTTLHPYLSFMQDNAPAHSSKYTKNWLKEHGIYSITWPPNSPDLNPIEIIWNWMKQWIQETYGIELDSVESQGKKMKPDRLRQMVQEAWEQISEEQLNGLVHSMQQRCQDVINAHGGNTKW